MANLRHDLIILFWFDAAGAVNQRAAGFQARRGLPEQFQLRRAQALDLHKFNNTPVNITTPTGPVISTWLSLSRQSIASDFHAALSAALVMP